ncbi:hypothetical protein JCM8547_000793 [Rhodosporidiobolus lusitaniae]
MSYMKLVGASELKWENGELQHEYWEFQIKLAAQLYSLIEQDKDDMTKNKAVPGLYKDHLLGLKPADEAKETYAWSKIQNLQYIVKYPPRQEGQARQDDSSSASSDLSKEDEEKVKKALELLRDFQPASFDELNMDIHPHSSSSSALKPFVPKSFPLPYRSDRRSLSSIFSSGFGRFGASSSKKKADDKKDQDKQSEPKTSDSFLSPLVGHDNKELTGWTRIDKVRDVMWQAHVLTARAATTLPSGIPLLLFGTPSNPSRD